jgi:hypothetical protein
MAKDKIEFVEFPSIVALIDGVKNKGITAAKLKERINPSPEQIKSLADFIAENKTLLHLDISYNNIGDAGAASIAKALPNSQLETLNIGLNNIGDAGAASIATELPNSKLETLNIGSNKIGDAGVASIATALPNSQLKALNIYYNGIGNAGAASIATALPNSQLGKLYINGNKITDAGAKVIAQALKKNTSLKILFNTFRLNGASKDIDNDIKKTLDENKILASDEQRRIYTAAGVAQQASIISGFEIPVELAISIGKLTEKAAKNTSYKEVLAAAEEAKTTTTTPSITEKPTDPIATSTPTTPTTETPTKTITSAEEKPRFAALIELQRSTRTSKIVSLRAKGDWTTVSEEQQGIKVR